MRTTIHILSIYLISLIFVLESFTQVLPDDFPTLHTIKTGETGEGYIFLTVSSDVEGIGYYVFMIDDEGQPIKYKKLDHDYSYDFKVQPNGLMSYARFLSHHTYTGGGNAIHMILDEEMQVVDSFQLGNGYIAEAHDFQLLPNGHVLAFGYYMTQMDLSDIVDGGYPNAMVSGGVVQELDQDKNVVWQWRSWDHYDKDNYDFGRGAKEEIVSQFPLNTINLDRDDNLILATPGWTKKIDRKTGEIMWHLGGDENEFSFVGVDSLDGVGDVTGHAFYRLENGNFLLYNNGPGKEAGTSEAHEYKLDEEQKIAEKIMTFTPDSEIGAWHSGNAQRLPNGNTLVGWGGATAAHIPTCTEFDDAGNTVLEVYFDDPVTESYRAVRFPYPPVLKYQGDIVTIALGNSYEMIQGDTLYIGVKIKITDLISPGYNELYIVTHDYAPRFPRFEGRAPMVSSQRVVMDEFSINAINGLISFDTAMFQITNPELITVYHRVVEGEGEFSPLPTTYNPVTGEITAEFNNAGEFIFTYPDIEHVISGSSPAFPANQSRLNYQKPVKLEWTPEGFFNSFDLQIAYDSTFSNLLLNLKRLKSTIFELDELSVNNDYYWRVKTSNDAGTSEWSDTAHFMIGSPFIEVTAPNGDEVWLRGVDYFIEWNDNIEEDVILELYHNNEKKLTIDTVESRNAYLWSVPADLDSACMYHIRIRSSVDSSIQDVSNLTFSFNDSTCTGEGVPQLKIESPNGGEILRQGEEILIEWSNNTGELITVELYKAGTMVSSLYTGADYSTVSWTVPDETEPGNEYRLVVKSEGSLQLADASNADFAIIDDENTSFGYAEQENMKLRIYPNPVNRELNLEYTLEFDGLVTIKIYNLAGIELETIVDESKQPGTHILKHNMGDYPAGSYIIQLITSQHKQSKLFNHH